MSVAELLKQVKSLSPSQRKKFVQSVLAMEQQRSKPKENKNARRRVKWPDILEQAKRVTGGRLLPDNIVLWDRDRHDF